MIELPKRFIQKGYAKYGKYAELQTDFAEKNILRNSQAF